MVQDIDDKTRFVRKHVAADAPGAAQARAELRRWLDHHFTIGADRVSDLLLAVNEAIANAAEFAYREAPQPGTIDVCATYDVDSDTLAVTVNDRGTWRPSVSEPHLYGFRGRGIPLMQALADEATIDPRPDGTHVTLTWTHLTSPPD
jgi:serine/threonine-protein kinase RsbW